MTILKNPMYTCPETRRINTVKSIYASKLFRSSRRQNKILAAMENPINTELIKQLEDYLDDEYKQLDESLLNSDANSDSSLESDDSNFITENNPKPNFSGAPVSTPQDTISDKYDDDLDEETEEPGESDTANETFNVSQQTNASIHVSKTSVAGSVTLQNPLVVTQNMYSSLVGEIKGTLNARNTTCGVSRVHIKNDELWIYYNDDINLNTVMQNTIELLNAASYHYLVFNRLARTDNAIVFDITDTDTTNVLGDGSTEN